MYGTGKYDEAAREYRIAAKAPGKIGRQAAAGIAWCLHEQKKHEGAAAAFLAAAKLPGNEEHAPALRFNAANALVATGDFLGASKEFAGLAETYPKHGLVPEARYWHGYCLSRLGRFAEAVVVLTKLRASGGPAGKKAELLYALAEAEFGSGRNEQAAKLYALVVKTFPRHELADQAAYNRMLSLEKSGDIAAAELAGKEFFAAFAKSDINHLARFALAEYRFRQRKYAAAASDLEQFVALGKPGELGGDAQYKLGWCWMNLKKPAKALQHFLNVCGKYPKNPLAAESAYMAGRAAEGTGNKDAARKRYADSIRVYNGTEYARRSELALVLMDLNSGQHREALARADAFLKANPDDSLADHAHTYRGEALIELGRFKEALAAYHSVKSKEAAPGPDAAYGAAWACRKMDDHRNAAASFLAVAKTKSPKAQDAFFWACRSLEDNKEFAAAARQYAVFITSYGSSSKRPEAGYRQALCTFKAGRLDEAEKLYAAFLAAHATSSLADNALYDLAWLNRDRNTTAPVPSGQDKEKNSAAATEYLKTLLQKYPASELVPDVQFRLGETAQNAEDYSTAARYYGLVLTHTNVPFADKVLYKLGWCHDHLRKAEQAIGAFTRLYKTFPKSTLAVEAHYRAGKLLQKSGKLDEARQQYDLVPAGNFKERALFQAAECLRRLNKHEEALRAYGRILKDYPGTEFITQVNLGRGHCFRSVNAHKDAMDAYRLVIKETDTIEGASAVMGLGYSLYASGKYKDAAKAFLKVDILYGYDELKPEALHMLSRSWEKAGLSAKSKKYRDELRRRYPDSKFAKE